MTCYDISCFVSLLNSNFCPLRLHNNCHATSSGKGSKCTKSDVILRNIERKITLKYRSSAFPSLWVNCLHNAHNCLHRSAFSKEVAYSYYLLINIRLILSHGKLPYQTNGQFGYNIQTNEMELNLDSNYKLFEAPTLAAKAMCTRHWSLRLLRAKTSHQGGVEEPSSGSRNFDRQAKSWQVYEKKKF